MKKTSTPASPDANADIALIARDAGVLDFPGHLFRVLDIRASECYTGMSPRPDVTPRQVAVLLVLYQVGTASQAQLSELIRTDRNTLAEMLSRMVQKRYIERTPSPDDRRMFNLTLADEGRALLFEVLPAMLRAQQALLQPLPAEYHGIFMKCLRLLAEGPEPVASEPEQTAKPLEK